MCLATLGTFQTQPQIGRPFNDFFFSSSYQWHDPYAFGAPRSLHRAQHDGYFEINGANFDGFDMQQELARPRVKARLASASIWRAAARKRRFRNERRCQVTHMGEFKEEGEDNRPDKGGQGNEPLRLQERTCTALYGAPEGPKPKVLVPLDPLH